MGGYNGKYSRNPFSVFNEEKDYAFALLPEGVPVTDDDSNDDRLCLYTKLRRGNQLFGNAGSPNDGFRVQQATSTTNNFKLTGGGVGNTDINAAGKFFLSGHSCVLLSDTDYLNDVSTIAKQSLHPRITNVFYNGSATVVEDSAANWATNELVARTVTIAGADYTVVTQPTVDTFTVAGDQTALIDIGDYYILKLTTPSGSAREDAVYLNVYIDEFDGTDDPDIMKSIGGTSVEAQLRAKVIHTLFVRQDNPGFGALTDYVDSNGNSHLIFKLAKLDRPNGDATIVTAYITDYVPTIGFTNISQDQFGSLKVIPNPAGADDKVHVQAGVFRDSLGSVMFTFGSGLSGAFGVVSGAAKERYDLVAMDDSGPSIVIIPGTEAATGNATIPLMLHTEDYTYLAAVYVDEAAGVQIDEADITDLRCVLSEASGSAIVARSTYSLAEILAGSGVGQPIYLNPGTYVVTGDLTLANGCRLFGPGNLNTTPGSATIEFNGGRLTLGAGAIVENVRFSVTAAGAHSEAILVSSDDAKIRNCQFLGTATRTRGIYVTSDNWTISGCTFATTFGGSSYTVEVADGADGGTIESNTFNVSAFHAISCRGDRTKFVKNVVNFTGAGFFVVLPAGGGTVGNTIIDENRLISNGSYECGIVLLNNTSGSASLSSVSICSNTAYLIRNAVRVIGGGAGASLVGASIANNAIYFDFHADGALLFKSGANTSIRQTSITGNNLAGGPAIIKTSGAGDVYDITVSANVLGWSAVAFAFSDTDVSRLSVTNNTVNSVGTNFITMSSNVMYDLVVTGNSCSSGASKFMTVLVLTNAVISNNQWITTTATGPQLQFSVGTQVKVLDNTLAMASTATGIYTTSLADSEISGNRVYTTSGTSASIGIDIHSGTVQGTKIDRNIIAGTYFGIHFGGVTTVTSSSVSKNDIEAAQCGIYLAITQVSQSTLCENTVAVTGDDATAAFIGGILWMVPTATTDNPGPERTLINDNVVRIIVNTDPANNAVYSSQAVVIGIGILAPTSVPTSYGFFSRSSISDNTISMTLNDVDAGLYSSYDAPILVNCGSINNSIISSNRVDVTVETLSTTQTGGTHGILVSANQASSSTGVNVDGNNVKISNKIVYAGTTFGISISHVEETTTNSNRIWIEMENLTLAIAIYGISIYSDAYHAVNSNCIHIIGGTNCTAVGIRIMSTASVCDYGTATGNQLRDISGTAGTSSILGVTSPDYWVVLANVFPSGVAASGFGGNSDFTNHNITAA